MELFKEMNEDSLTQVLQILNEWWRDENIPEETLRARVVMIYKKGDTSKFENYRPISLLNSLYKIFAAVIQNRIADKLDKHLQKTQFGFRKDKSTADAIYLVRRIAEYGEQTTNKLIMVLLDWEKAFDKVTREGLFNAMRRMNIHPKLIQLVQSIYRKTEFAVEVEGVASEWTEQQTGIRQGCPLSP